MAKKSHSPAATRFAGRNQIEPAVVVVVERSNPPAALPAQLRESNALQPLAFHISPQADTRRARMRERQIHPAVFIEIESHHADGWRQLLFAEIDAGERGKFPFAGIE